MKRTIKISKKSNPKNFIMIQNCSIQKTNPLLIKDLMTNYAFKQLKKI